MPEDQSTIDNVEIEPLSDHDLEGAAGGNEFELIEDGCKPTPSSSPYVCSCRSCS